jgi:TP901 family phage tail tape measure protein
VTEFNLKLIFQAIDRISAPAGKMAKAIGQLSRDTGLDEVAKTAGPAAKALGKTALEAGKVAGALSLAAGGGFAFVKKFANAGDVIAKTADKLGVGIEALQRLEHHAELSGVASGSLHDSLRFLLNAAGEASKGMGAARETFADLGISVTDGSGRMKDAETLMYEVADAMSRIEDPVTRVSMAQDLFGRSGVDLINALKGGADVMRASGKEAERLGIITEEQARQAEVFNDSVSRLTRVLSNIGFILANQLMPPLTEFVGWLQEVAIEARPEILEAFQSGLAAVQEVLPALVSGMGTTTAVVGTLVGWLAWAVELTIGWERAGQVLMGLFAGKLLASIVGAIGPVFIFGRALLFAAGKMLLLGGRAAASLIGSLGRLSPVLKAAAGGVRALGLAIMSTPVGWIIAGIATVIAVAWLLYENWEEISAYFSKLWNEVTAAFDEGFIQGIMKLIENFNPVSILIDAVNGLIKYLFGIDLMAIGSEWIGGFGEGVRQTFTDLMNWIVGTLKETLSFLPESWLEKLGMSGLSDAGGVAPAASAVPTALAPGNQSSFSGELRISIPDAPKGTRVETVRKKGDDLSLISDVGYAMAP